jgi:hypothetical protein
MVRYFYAWMPAVVLVGSVVVACCAYLAVILLMAVLLAVVAFLVALAWATVRAVHGLGRAAFSRVSFHTLCESGLRREAGEAPLSRHSLGTGLGDRSGGAQGSSGHVEEGIPRTENPRIAG